MVNFPLIEATGRTRQPLPHRLDELPDMLRAEPIPGHQETGHRVAQQLVQGRLGIAEILPGASFGHAAMMAARDDGRVTGSRQGGGTSGGDMRALALGASALIMVHNNPAP